MASSVFGIVTSEAHLRTVITRLDQAGFRRDDRSVIFPDKSNPHPIAHEKGSKAPEGAVTGGLTGAGIGGVVGLLAGLGALAIPGLGPFIAAGPLLALLSGAAVGAAAGSLAGSLIGMGIPEYEAKRYESHLKEGNILLAVHADNSEWATKAKTLMIEAGVLDVAVSKEAAVKDRDESTASLTGSDETDYTDITPANRRKAAQNAPTDYSLPR